MVVGSSVGVAAAGLVVCPISFAGAENVLEIYRKYFGNILEIYRKL